MKLEKLYITYHDVDNTKLRVSTKVYIILSILFMIALAIFAAGIVLLFQENNCQENKEQQDDKSRPLGKIQDLNQYCELSEEAQRINLTALVWKLQRLYFKTFPNEELVHAKDEEINQIARRYKPYNPTQEYLKNLTDDVRRLRQDLEMLNVSEVNLKPREARILAEIEVFLNQHFATFYGTDYYTGEWMLGPNYFCMDRICDLGSELHMLLSYFRPETEEDIFYLYKLFRGFNQTFKQYTENMKEGVRKGMIRSKSACIAGRNAFKQRYRSIFNNDPHNVSWSSPIFARVFTADFYSGLEEGFKDRWEKKYGEKIYVNLLYAIYSGFTLPLLEFYKYLTEEHERHCPPDNAASGVSSLPLDFEYLDGEILRDHPTNKTLTLTGTELDGKYLYERAVRRFTTTDISPEDIYEEGIRQIEVFYPKIIELSKKITKEANETVALKKIKTILESEDQYHGKKKFPENESNSEAHARCVDDVSAKKHCPTRWKSIQKWAKYIQRTMSMIHPQLTYSFYLTGEKNSVPNCPIAIERIYNPSSGAVYFKPSDENCTFPTYFGLPFFLENYGPRYQDWSVIGHESRPGHHFQYQGSVELFRDPCEGDVESYFHSKGHFSGFIEGWAVYSENPVLSDDVMLYKGNPLQKLGMYKWQVWRAIRLVVDSGLHYLNKTRSWALEQFKKFALDESDFVRKEVTRYMSAPGQATSYMIGRLAILNARRKAEKSLGFRFDLKEFHYQVLSLGQVPLGYFTKHLDRYLSCVNNSTQAFCEYYLTPVQTIPPGKVHRRAYAKRSPARFQRAFHA